MENPLLVNWEKKSRERQKLYKQFLQRVSKNEVLSRQQDIHEEAFNKVDCLSCANCCKNYSPRFKTPDIKRISKLLGLREGVFIEIYLKEDEDGDFVLQTAPCPFLGSDNFCSIYEDRPSDCRRFPYTDEDVLIKRASLTIKNSSFCPITYYTLERLMQDIPQR
ncbi:MAG TPA: zinc/iron-chelating domain-containing protein [Chitinophagaceae bacterium]|nr:zinc/iron-chelating domain-containing protein [Chitinophagaceae bacterium]